MIQRFNGVISYFYQTIPIIVLIKLKYSVLKWLKEWNIGIDTYK